MKDMKTVERSLKKLFESRGSDKEKMEITPFRDWRTVVIVFFAGLVASFVWSAYLFVGVNTDSFFKRAEKPAAGATLNHVGLGEIDKRLSESAERFEKILKEGVAVSDPGM